LKGILNYENLSKRTLNSGERRSPNGRKLLPIKLGITDECQHMNHDIKVRFETIHIYLKKKHLTMINVFLTFLFIF
jgi:hypothetical protein